MSTIHLKGRQGHQTQVTKWWLKHGKKEGEKAKLYTCWCKKKKAKSQRIHEASDNRHRLTLEPPGRAQSYHLKLQTSRIAR